MLTPDLVRDLRKQYITNYGCEPRFIEASSHDPVPQGFPNDGYSYHFGNIRIFIASYLKSGEITIGAPNKPTLTWKKDDSKPQASSSLPAASSSHKHKWIKYTGFTESYDYCECGVKK